jgi:hypothetical protein
MFAGGALAAGGGGTGGGGTGGGGTGGGGTGGGAVGGGTVCDTTPVLPTTAPEAGVIMRDSFGLANLARPTGGKGCLKFYNVHTALVGFWMEYPGSKNTAWLAPSESTQTWRACAMNDDPYEMPSPIQATWGNGCIVSDWIDPVLTRPTALVPFTPPAAPYQISIDAWPATDASADYYVGFGLTDVSILESNLETSAGVWLELKFIDSVLNMSSYALRADGRTGPVLATGTVPFGPHTRLVLRYDPAGQTVSASVDGIELGVYVQPIRTPRFIGIEGVGIVDNFVVRSPF